MAPVPHSVPEGTYVITLKFEPTDDPEITCIVCHRPLCELECTMRRADNSRITIGKHYACTLRGIS